MKIVEVEQSERSIRRELMRNTEQRRDLQPCVLVGVDYVDSPAVAGRPGFLWARESSSASDESGGVFPVLNTSLAQVSIDLPVLVGPAPRAPYQRQIIGLNTDKIQTTQFNPSQVIRYYDTGPHAATHVNLRGGLNSSFGGDVLFATDANLLSCLVVPDDPLSMRVYINRGMYMHKGEPKTWSGGYSDYLYDSVPGAGLARLVYILIDGDTNAIEILEGPTFSVQTPFADAIPHTALVSISIGRVLVGRIYMYPGMPNISEVNFLYDAKPVLRTASADVYWLSDLGDVDPGYDPDDGDLLQYNGTYWVTLPMPDHDHSGVEEGGSLEGVYWTWFQIIFSLEGLATVSSNPLRLYVPCTLTIDRVYIAVNTAPTGANLIVDVNKNGVTIFTNQANRPEIVAGAYTDESGIPDITALAADDYLTMDVDQIGSTLPGSDLTVHIRCKQYINI